MKQLNLQLSLLFSFMLCSVSVLAYGEALTINNYLDMVAKDNSDLKSIQSNIDAVKGKLAEIERVYEYSFSVGINYSDDESGRPYSQSNRLSDVSNWNYDASINKQFETGTQLSLGVNGSYGTYNFVNDAPPYYTISDIAPFVKLQQSLLKDINGGSTKASIAKQKASAKSVLYLLRYKKQKLLFDARIAYWNLSYARTVIYFKKVSLDRKKRLLDWNEKRYKMDLAEKSDLLQSEAAVKSGELNLKLAYEDENRANRAFNQFLNIKDEKVKYDVEKFEDKGTSFKVNRTLTKNRTRADVLAALEDVNTALYDQEASKKNKGADLVLEGKYSLNGLEQSSGKAFEHVRNGDRPSYSVGLRYTIPLDFKLRKAIDKGYEAAKISAQSAAESSVVRENNDWIQLLDDWNNAKIRLDLAFEVEKIQKQRYEEDGNLLKRGRTTTYMLLQSEEDLDSANLNVLRGILELIQIYEQAKAFYGGVNEDLEKDIR
ncbi:MAG: TolC family protein [Endomicrobium sp.]|jgi:outer membrane protein TolC|nr:TolC family protein [Endomicrobium sp.]